MNRIDCLFPKLHKNNFIYFVTLALTIVYLLKSETLWSWSENMYFAFKVVISLFDLILLLLAIPKYRYNILCVILVGILLTIIGERTQHLYELLFSYCLIVCAKGYNFNNILKMYLLVSVSFSVVTIMASLLGIIKSFSIDIDSQLIEVGLNFNSNRRTFGYCWHTDFANHIFFMILTYWCIKKGKFNSIEYVLMILVTFIVLYYTQARLGSFSILLILLISRIYGKIEARIIKYKNICCLIVTFCFFLTIWCTISYNSNSLYWNICDMIFTGRFSFGQSILETNQMSFLGQYYDNVGGITKTKDEYTFIDSSYLQMLVIYGVLFCFLLNIVYIYICKKAIEKNIVVFLSILLAAITGIISQHFIQLAMNPFVLCTLSNISKK